MKETHFLFLVHLSTFVLLRISKTRIDRNNKDEYVVIGSVPPLRTRGMFLRSVQCTVIRPYPVGE